MQPSAPSSRYLLNARFAAWCCQEFELDMGSEVIENDKEFDSFSVPPRASTCLHEGFPGLNSSMLLLLLLATRILYVSLSDCLTDSLSAIQEASFTCADPRLSYCGTTERAHARAALPLSCACGCRSQKEQPLLREPFLEKLSDSLSDSIRIHAAIHMP